MPLISLNEIKMYLVQIGCEGFLIFWEYLLFYIWKSSHMSIYCKRQTTWSNQFCYLFYVSSNKWLWI